MIEWLLLAYFALIGAVVGLLLLLIDWILGLILGDEPQDQATTNHRQTNRKDS